MFLVLFFYLFAFSRAAPTAFGGSQARGLIRAVAAGLHHSHSNAGSLTHGAKPGIEPATSWFLVGFVSTAPPRERLSGILISLIAQLGFQNGNLSLGGVGVFSKPFPGCA